ncbi:MAG: RIP metalloprotease RseP [Firmicutes bacterium]|nr:RIP metalloprotease RseP [Bacillota bacterium]
MLKTIIASVIIFGLLIFVHEFGHFIVARLVRVRVLEFAIGFGKELFGWCKDGTQYSLRLFPLGGFCRMLGDDPEEMHKEGSFQGKPLISRFAVIFAGPFMNFFLAMILFSLIYFFFLGVPQNQVAKIGEVLPESRASEAGLKPGDVVLSVDGSPAKNWDDVVHFINTNPEKQITLHIQRNSSELFIPVIPGEEEGKGLIGIAPVYKKYIFFSSIKLGIIYTWFFIKLIFVSLYQMITGAIPADFAGPVGIIAVVAEVSETGLGNLFYLASIISINLGIINLLPIPALDGSRIIFLALEGIRGKPIDPQKEGFIHFIGFSLLILLMILIAFQDVTRLFF